MRTKLLLACGVAWSSSALADCAPCGPDFCLSDPRYPGALAAKTMSLRRGGYPERLIALMDRDGACVARVERAPDGFTIWRVAPGGAKRSSPWTASDEAAATAELKAGSLRAYYMYNVNRAFSCCAQPRYDQRADWNRDLDLNTGLAIACERSGADVACR